MAGKSEQLAINRIRDHDYMAEKYHSRSFTHPRVQHREGTKGSYSLVDRSNEAKWISLIEIDEFKPNTTDDQQRTNHVSALHRTK